MSSCHPNSVNAFIDQRPGSSRNKSIIAYLLGNGFTETAASFRKECNITMDKFDAVVASKYETLLEKKWASNARLQKKVTSLFPVQA